MFFRGQAEIAPPESPLTSILQMLGTEGLLTVR